MKFLICTDPKKIKNHEIYSLGNYYYCHDEEVNLYRGMGCDILWQGYTIEQPIEELLDDWWALKRANGNFFAVRIMPHKIDYALDYFNNHKIFSSHKYGFEMSNHLPWMTKNEYDDIVRDSLQYEPFIRREFSQNECTTFFEHIHSVLPAYDYVSDSKEAYNSKLRNDPDELADYIHRCMEQHAKVIKERYPNRFICLSEGMDSALQSQYFRDDPQYMYTIVPCSAGEKGRRYKEIVAGHYPNVHFEEFHVDRMAEYTHKYLNDSTTRWATILPTMKQIADCEVKPDIVMYGVNGDEMFVRDLIPHMQMLAFEYWDHDQALVEQRLREDIASKSDQYGSSYTVGDDETFEAHLNYFASGWFRKWRSREDAESAMLKWTTPKFYTRAITQNNEVMTASLYNDRRIFHEVLKCPPMWLREQGMDSPIQRKILKDKFDYELVTPYKDALYANYDDIFANIFDSTVPKAMAQTV